MADAESKSWLRSRVEKTLTKALTRAYSTVQVDPSKFLLQLRTAYRLPISGYHGVYSLDMGEIDVVADEIIRSGMKLAAVEGAGFGLGGLITIFPDLGVLTAITMRTIQQLSQVYGFQLRTARDPSYRRPRQRGSRGEVGRTTDSADQFRHRRRAELLVCARLGRTRKSSLPQAPHPTSPASAAGSIGASSAANSASALSLTVLCDKKEVIKKRMPTFPCSAILFDLDGVLVDSTGSGGRQWRIWARERGIDEEKVIAIAHGGGPLEVLWTIA